jgi:anti-sigma B factor antagonist
MKIKKNPQENCMLLELSGKIMGGPDFDKFKGEIHDLIEEGYKNVILDMAGVPWINSTGLGILITGYHSIKAAEGSMKICNVKERVLSIFYISQLENIFDVFETRDEALASVKS